MDGLKLLYWLPLWTVSQWLVGVVCCIGGHNEQWLVIKRLRLKTVGIAISFSSWDSKVFYVFRYEPGFMCDHQTISEIHKLDNSPEKWDLMQLELAIAFSCGLKFRLNLYVFDQIRSNGDDQWSDMLSNNIYLFTYQTEKTSPNF